jgi:hypothetical protein
MAGERRRAHCALIAAVIFAATPICAAYASDLSTQTSTLTPEAGCAQIRASIDRLADAERNQAFALHLMGNGKPTEMVETRLAQLDERCSDLRGTLRSVRNRTPLDDARVSECVEMGFEQLNKAESLSRDIQSIVASQGGALGIPDQLKQFPPEDERKLPTPPLPSGPDHAE